MRIDVYTKVILTVIAVALVLPQFTKYSYAHNSNWTKTCAEGSGMSVV